jgi:hypothetical protein
VLRGVWRASSLAECVNSVARMQQARNRRMTQGLLDPKRLDWNLRRFRAGCREGQTPYGLLGLKLPELSFWHSSGRPRRDRGKDCPRREIRREMVTYCRADHRVEFPTIRPRKRYPTNGGRTGRAP